MKLKIQVEDMHIRCGRKNTGHACPIALAITPRLPAGQVAYVGRGWWGIDVGGGKTLNTFDLPPEADAFVTAFDSGKKVKPFEFEVEI